MKSNDSPVNDFGGPDKPIHVLVRGGTAITMSPGREIIRDACILISGDRIVEIGSWDEIALPKGSFPETIHAGDAIIMPGLVNGHGHTAMTLFRGFADDMPLRKWLFDRIFPAEAAFLSQETVYWGTLLGCIEMITSGTTCLADGYFFQDETVRAVNASGLRALLAQGVIDFPAPGVPDPAQNLAVAQRFLERWHGFSDRITPGLFCHSPLTCSEKTLCGSKELSGKYGTPLQIHLSETAQEVSEIVERNGKRPAHFLDQLGLLDKDLIAAHCVHLDEGELECFSERDAGIIHVPESNMKLSSGVAPLAKILAMGIKTGLGTDGSASNNNLDLFGEMDTAAKLSKVMTGKPDTANAWQVLQMATLGGAAALGIDHETGSLAKGKKADIIVVDLNSPHLSPLYDPAAALVYSASGADVKDVIVDGKILMAERALRFLDPQEIMVRVREISSKIRA